MMEIYRTSRLKELRETVHQEGVKYALLRASEQLMANLPGISAAYWKIAPKFYHWLYSHRFDEYNPPVFPCKHLWIDPEKIVYKTNRNYKGGIGRRRKFIGVSAGDWDAQTDKLASDPKLDGLHERFIQNKEWEETKLYTHCSNMIDKHGQHWHGCTDREDILNRCQKLDYIYKNIKQNGYKTQLELRHSNGVTDYVDALVNEILVDIGRNGEILYVTGKHRLTIAKILGLDRIPVICDHRHEKWMEKREELFENNKSIAHPDIPSNK